MAPVRHLQRRAYGLVGAESAPPDPPTVSDPVLAPPAAACRRRICLRHDGLVTIVPIKGKTRNPEATFAGMKASSTVSRRCLEVSSNVSDPRPRGCPQRDTSFSG